MIWLITRRKKEKAFFLAERKSVDKNLRKAMKITKFSDELLLSWKLIELFTAKMLRERFIITMGKHSPKYALLLEKRFSCSQNFNFENLICQIPDFKLRNKL